LPEADVVVANIALRPILRLAERWQHAGAHPAPPSELLLSGLLVEQAGEALAAFPAFTETARTDDGTWMTLHLSRRAVPEAT
jgi:ribosomal protein L11 methylase PrmA